VVCVLAAGGVAFYLISKGSSTHIMSLGESGLAIFRFTGGGDDVRTALYASAVAMLKASPLVGVGFGQIMMEARTLFPALVPEGLENLHADWANFAAMAGGLGLLAYLCLLAAPLLLLMQASARRDRAIILGAVLLTVGQLSLGVSNATFLKPLRMASR
jgi:O-antigen ligase